MKSKTKRASLALIVILSGSTLFYVVNITPNAFGPYHDDSVYVVMAKALATDQGYRIISLPNEPPQTKSPPFYLLLLSLVWRIYPKFPENLVPMMVLSILATIASLALCWLYLVKHNYSTAWRSLLIVSLVAMNWRTVILATGIYSEMTYLAISITTLYLAEDYEGRKGNWLRGVGLGFMLGLAFLTRSSGITLLLAVGSYFILRRQLRMALIPLAVGSALVLAWIAWGYFTPSPPDSLNAGYSESYFQTFREIFATSESTAKSLMTFVAVLAKNGLMLIFVSIPVVCLGLVYDWPHTLPPSIFNIGLGLFIMTFVFIVAGFRRHVAQGIRLLHIYVVFFLCLHILWPYTAYDRFLMPLLPFLLMFWVAEIERLVLLVKNELQSTKQIMAKASASLVGLILCVLISTAFYIYYLGISRLSVYSQEMARRNAEDIQAIEWINAHTDPSDVLICYRDPKYYLYTGRKSARSSPMREGGLVNETQASFDDQAKVIFRILKENRARYLVLTWTDLELKDQADIYQNTYKMLPDRYPQIFVPVFRSADERSTIYRIEKDDNVSL